MLVKVETSGSSSVESRVFEFAELPSGSFVDVQYLSDTVYLNDPDNGYMLSGMPTDKFSRLIQHVEVVNKNTWREGIADATFFDMRPFFAGNTDTVKTFFDVVPTEMLAGVGDFDDLKVHGVVQTKNPDIMNFSNTIVSGSLSGVFLPQAINADNYFQYRPIVNPGYFTINSGEYFMYDIKVTEHLVPSEMSGSSYVYQLSGHPLDFMPLFISMPSSLPTVECGRYPYRTGVFNETIETFEDNMSPRTRIHKVPASGSTTDIMLPSLDFNNYYDNETNSIVSTFSGSLLVTYGDKGGPPIEIDLSPLSYTDKDRVLCIRDSIPTVGSLAGSAYVSTMVDMNQLSVTHNGTTIQYPVLGIGHDVSGRATKVMTINATVLDSDGVPMSGVPTDIHLTNQLIDLSGNVLDLTSSTIVSKMPMIYESTFSGVTPDTELTVDPLFQLITTSGATSPCFINGIPTLMSGTQGEVPLVAALLCSEIIAGSTINTDLAFEETLVSDQYGNLQIPVYVNSTYGFPRNLSVSISVSGSSLIVPLNIIPDSQNAISYSVVNGPVITRQYDIYDLQIGQAVQLKGMPVGCGYGVKCHDPDIFISNSLSTLSGQIMGDVFNINDSWFFVPDVSGTYAVEYMYNECDAIIFDKGFKYE